MFMAIAMIAAFTSCVKSTVATDQYLGDKKTFVYHPSLITATGAFTVNLADKTARVYMSNGSSITVDILEPNGGGDAFITEFPVYPESLVWSQTNYQYFPEGSVWNAKNGFGPSMATVTFVERTIYGTHSLKIEKAVGWAFLPNIKSWVDSFRGVNGISSIVMPRKGAIGFGSNPNQYFFSLP